MPYQLRCPKCRGAFPFDPSKERMPQYCRLKACGEYIGNDRADDDIVMPFIRSKDLMKKTDQVYCDMEKSSEVRAQMAADVAGVPVSEMSDLKITNMREASKQGEVAAMPVNNVVTQFMEQNKVGGYQGGVAGDTYAPSVKTGPYPNRGIRTAATYSKIFRGG